MPWQNAGMNGEMPLGADQLTPPAAQPPAAAPLSPQDRYAALVAFANGSGPKPAWYGQQSGGSNPQTAELAATGRYDPTQLSQVMGPPTAAAPPPAGAQAPPAIATAPPNMASPMFAMPQMYTPDTAPANVQMQQMPGGQLVDQSQAGAAKHALGLDRLPDFKTYAQQNGVTTGSSQLGANSPAATQNQILQQYLGLQAGQSQGDQNSTARMTAADTGAYQRGMVGTAQQENALKSYQASLPYMGALTAMQGINSGQVDGFQALKNQQLIGQLAGGIGSPPGMPGQPQGPAAGPTQGPTPQGPAAGPTQGPTPQGQTAGAPQRPGTDPLLSADPSAMEYAFNAAAKEGSPKGPDGKPVPRTQAETVVQFENAHPGLLKSNPQVFNSLTSYLSREGQGGDAGLQSLWRTTQGNIGNMLGGPPSTAQRAQSILQNAMEQATGMTTPRSWMGIPISGSQPLHPVSAPAPPPPPVDWTPLAGFQG